MVGFMHALVLPAISDALAHILECMRKATAHAAQHTGAMLVLVLVPCIVRTL